MITEVRDDGRDLAVTKPDTSGILRARAAATRRRRVRWALGCLVVGVSLVGFTAFWARTVVGAGQDMGAHYLLVSWIMEHWQLPSSEPGLQGYSGYPAGAHILGAIAGEAVGSPFLGMQLVAYGAITTTWLATASLLAMYPGVKRYLALACLAALVLVNSPMGPLSAQGYGSEIVVTYFFSQAAGQAVFALTALWVVYAIRQRRDYIATAVPVAAAALVSTAFHVVTSLELLTLLALLSLRQLRSRSSPRSVLAALIAPVVTSIIVVISPGVRHMAGGASQDGYLELPYLPSPGWVGALASLVLAISVALAVASQQREQTRSNRITVGIAIVGASVALPALALWCDFEFVSAASPYAVKKFGYALMTMLAVQVCGAVALFAPKSLERSPFRPWAAFIPFTALAIALITGCAMWAAYSPQDQVRTFELTRMEEGVRSNATALDSPPGTLDLAMDMYGPTDRFYRDSFDFMFTVGSLHALERGAVLGADPGLGSLFASKPRFPAEPKLSKVLTREGSPTDVLACRVAPPIDRFVVLHADCLVANGKLG